MSILNKITKTKTVKNPKEVNFGSTAIASEHKKNRLAADKIGMVIQKPVITEKTSLLAELNKYVFKVANNATKNEVRKAVETLYGVNVVSVNILKTAAKPRRIGRNIVAKGAFKKAIVAVKMGENIDFAKG